MKTNHYILNLLKYDLLFIYKQLIIFYIIILSCAIIARLTNVETTSFWLKFIHGFAQGATFGFSFGALINGSIRIWYRFRSSLYGDESYLTHTLPVSQKQLWASKFLTSIIISLCNLIIVIVAMLILFFPISECLRSFGFKPEDIPAFLGTVIASAIAILLQVIFIIQSGYTGILLGYRASNHRHPLSVVAGFITYLLGGLIIISSCFIWANFNHSVDMLLHGQTYENTIAIVDGEFTDMQTYQANIVELLCGIGILYIILISVMYFLNQHLLQKGVNVD